MKSVLYHFQQYFIHITATVHIIHVFPGFHKYLAGAQIHSHEKTQRIQCGSNSGPLDYQSNTLPLSHAGTPGLLWMTKPHRTPSLIIYLDHMICTIQFFNLLPAFSPFLTMFSTIYNRINIILSFN